MSYFHLLILQKNSEMFLDFLDIQKAAKEKPDKSSNKPEKGSKKSGKKSSMAPTRFSAELSKVRFRDKSCIDMYFFLSATE